MEDVKLDARLLDGGDCGEGVVKHGGDALEVVTEHGFHSGGEMWGGDVCKTAVTFADGGGATDGAGAVKSVMDDELEGGEGVMETEGGGVGGDGAKKLGAYDRGCDGGALGWGGTLQLVKKDGILVGHMGDAEEGLGSGVQYTLEGIHESVRIHDGVFDKGGCELDEFVHDADAESEGGDGMEGDDEQTDKVAVGIIGGGGGVVWVGMEGSGLGAEDIVLAVKRGMR